MAKVALITGCSKGGIGDAIAQAFLKEGVQVFATGRDMEKINHLKEMGCEALLLDVTSTASIQNVLNTVTKQTSRLDFLVNNAGRAHWPGGDTGHTCPLADVDLQSAMETFNLNVLSALAVTQAFLPLLIAAKGKVINIGSIGGKVVTPFTGIYAASKAALNSMSETLRVELAPFDVQVITVRYPHLSLYILPSDNA
ncbi:NADPH-dependent 1-acyldihydroxyacetone phosphate reductase [Talaromyces pinophilus]|nr:NADPH-dependent 1-acyldihydroxyacetone phosphate reductase [Talaromyces pinophilus]